MSTFSCLAIDMGAGSIRGILGVFNRTLTLTEVFRFDNHIIEYDGHDRWDLQAIEAGIRLGIEKALRNNDYPIQSISVDSWGVDFVLIGKDGVPLGLPVAYRDKRTTGMEDQWHREGLSKQETFERSGINYYPFNTLFQLLSMRQHPIWEKTDTLLFTANYINYFLSGKAVNELSLASTSQLLNIETKTWDELIISKLFLDKTILGEVIECGHPIGRLKPEFSARPVTVCTVPSHDTASAVEAIPAKTDNYAYIATGTWCIVGMPSEKPVTSSLALETGITNEVNTRHKIKVNKNIMGLWLVQKLREVLIPGEAFNVIDDLAGNCDWNGIVVDPDNPLFYNPDNMQQAFDEALKELGQDRFATSSEYFRCAYESLARSFCETIKVLEQLRNQTFEVVHIIGGGAKSALLCQLTANQLNLPVVAGPVEGAAIGNCLWQARALGFISSDREAAEWVIRSFDVKTYFPQH